MPSVNNKNKARLSSSSEQKRAVQTARPLPETEAAEGSACCDCEYQTGVTSVLARFLLLVTAGSDKTAKFVAQTLQVCRGSLARA